MRVLAVACLMAMLSIASSAGAAATVIDARSTPALRSVFLVGDGIVFGKHLGSEA